MGCGSSKPFGELEVVPFVQTPFAEPCDVTKAETRKDVQRLDVTESLYYSGWITSVADADSGEVLYESKVVSSWKKISKSMNSDGNVVAFFRCKMRFMKGIDYCLRTQPSYEGQEVLEEDQMEGESPLYRFYRVKVRRGGFEHARHHRSRRRHCVHARRSRNRS